MARQNRAFKVLGAVLLIGLGWWAIEGQPGPVAWAAAAFNRVTNSSQAPVLSVSQSAPVSGRVPNGTGNPTMTASLATSTSGPSRFAGQERGLGLTRQLGGEQKVSYGGRDRTVLGTKEVVDPSGPPQTVLLVRDEESGQIDYWQPGLRVELKPGNDYAAFIAERTGLTRRFANSQYADVGVDAADIARIHAELAADPRVVRVEFLPVRVPPKAR